MSEEALFALLGEIEAPENELDDERDTYEDAYDKYDFLNFVNFSCRESIFPTSITFRLSGK